MAVQHKLPSVPVKHSDLLQYLQSHPNEAIIDLLRPYSEYDAVLRKVFAQEPHHPAIADNVLSVVPLFDANGSVDLKVRARDLAAESEEVKSKYVMPLKDKDRRPNGSPAVVPTLKQFQTNFNIFSEGSLCDFDWSNVVAVGSAVTTSLLPVPDKYADSKRGLRQFYHEEFAPASDVDLFLYGLTEEQAIEKIKQIERCIRDSVLTEITTIRTKHAITIVSHYPTRHVQIVLRLYKSIAEILTGFDVDCSCAAYDGRQVYLAPRAVGAFVTQVNQVDLSRRSPSYEYRLSKYSHRGFEVFWAGLDRSRIDPTIFERSFKRTVGLARLLVLEKLPKSSDREQYLDQRRRERGRPAKSNSRYRRKLWGNIKEQWDDEVPDWVDGEEVSDYHTFNIPYGKKYHARKIEKLLYTKDLLLNAEWNRPKDRAVNLHRHPAFFGSVDDVIHDCCGYCPQPVTPEEKEMAEEESKIYVSGDVSFLVDDPGRQEIGSFYPITESDWTEMAYVGNTEGLCHAIVDCDLEAVQDWLEKGIDVNRRDHTGRTPLHLATMVSTPRVVQCLVDHGARLIWRLADGRTALHLAAERGSMEIVRILLTKSEQNEEEAARMEARQREENDREALHGASYNEDDAELINSASDDDDADDRSYVTGSFVKVKKEDQPSEGESTMPEDPNEHEPDVYDVNIVAWDTHSSPLHLAILNGHIEIVEELVTSFGADALLPIKLLYAHDNTPRAAILTLVLALRLPMEKAKSMTAKLLQLGASPAQADLDRTPALHYLASTAYDDILDVYVHHDQPAVERVLNYLSVSGSYYNISVDSALTTAITAKNPIMAIKLLEAGAQPSISFDEFAESSRHLYFVRSQSAEQNHALFKKQIDQPVIRAVEQDLPHVGIELLVRGADPNTLTSEGYAALEDSHLRQRTPGRSLLDYVREKLTALRGYRGEKTRSAAPKPLDFDDDEYLKEFQVGTYQHWKAKGMLAAERRKYRQQQQVYEKELKAAAKRAGLQEKKASIKTLVEEFEKLEADLLARGAKSFKQLHPDIPAPDKTDSRFGFGSKPEVQSFKINFGFNRYDLTEDMRRDYLQLFEAAWSGDIDTIKKLTTTVRRKSKDRQPLEISVTDTESYSPFTIAVLRGHLDAARAILAISAAQYKPNEDKDKTRYRMHQSSEDYDIASEADESDSEGIQLKSHIVEAEFTVENIGEIKTEVESNISPLTVLAGRCNINVFLEGEQSPKYNINCLIGYAIWKDDIDLLDFLLTLGQQLTPSYCGDAESPLYAVHDSEFITAIRLGRLRCLEKLIKSTGSGLPLDGLAEESGVEVKEKPKYYRGLSVHGKKRADWAAAGREIRVTQSMADVSPPLLLAAKMGNLEVVEWFLGTAPGRHYVEFAMANKHDKRLQRLALTDKGLEGSILDWLDAGRDLVLHCAVLANKTEESEKIIEYLAKNMPDCLEAKSVRGCTLWPWPSIAAGWNPPEP